MCFYTLPTLLLWLLTLTKSDKECRQMVNITGLFTLHVTSLKLVAFAGVQIIPAFVIQLRAVLFPTLTYQI